MTHRIVVFGRPGCPYTVRAVQELVADGRYPFAYVSLPAGMSREDWWKFVQKRAPRATIRHSFPTIITWTPKAQVFDSSGVRQIVQSQDPGQFYSNVLQRRTNPKNVERAIADGDNFSFWPKPTLYPNYPRRPSL